MSWSLLPVGIGDSVQVSSVGGCISSGLGGWQRLEWMARSLLVFRGWIEKEMKKKIASGEAGAGLS